MLKEKNIVVTGSNRGIGLAIVDKCAQNGANVFACIRNDNSEVRNQFNAIEEKYLVKIWPVILDVMDEQTIKLAVTEIISKNVPIDGIVNNIGVVGTNNTFMMMPMTNIKRTFDINFFGPMLFTQRLLKRMIKNKKGSIVYISSAAALDGDPAQFDYVTSKAAIIGAIRKLAIELGNYGIRVNAIAPGVTNTDMVSSMHKDLLEETLRNTDLKRIGTPEEIAGTVEFLLSDTSGYITGQVLRVDGGLHA